MTGSVGADKATAHETSTLDVLECSGAALVNGRDLGNVVAAELLHIIRFVVDAMACRT